VAEKTFVIRIWYEYSEQSDVKPQFRGVIKHATNGQQQYLKSTHNIHHFIQPHLPKTTRSKDPH